MYWMGVWGFFAKWCEFSVFAANVGLLLLGDSFPLLSNMSDVAPSSCPCDPLSDTEAFLRQISSGQTQKCRAHLRSRDICRTFLL